MRQSRSQAVACGLGWFSLGLGVAELVAPRLVAKAFGFRCPASVVRLYGAREIVTGVGILLSWKRSPWIWARVAGDAIDLSTTRSPAGIAALAGVSALDVATAVQLSREESRPMPRRYDYSDRSGFPRPAAEMRGAGRLKNDLSYNSSRGSTSTTQGT